MSEELIFYTLAQRMAAVRWRRANENVDRKFLTIAREVKLFSDVPKAQQPACFQAEWSDNVNQVTSMPYKTTLECNWIIYQAVKGTGQLGAVENNLIIDGVKAALQPKPDDPGFQDERCTLGGLVHHCFIQGRLFKDPGDIDGQGMIVIPIKLLVP